MGRRLTAELRRQGFTYNTARRRISVRGRREVRFPYRYLGADDTAGPNYTGQPAVDSFYAWTAGAAAGTSRGWTAPQRVSIRPRAGGA